MGDGTYRTYTAYGTYRGRGMPFFGCTLIEGCGLRTAF